MEFFRMGFLELGHGCLYATAYVGEMDKYLGLVIYGPSASHRRKLWNHFFEMVGLPILEQLASSSVLDREDYGKVKDRVMKYLTARQRKTEGLYFVLTNSRLGGFDHMEFGIEDMMFGKEPFMIIGGSKVVVEDTPIKRVFAKIDKGDVDSFRVLRSVPGKPENRSRKNAREFVEKLGKEEKFRVKYEH